MDADVFLKQLEHDGMSEEVSQQFQRQFERLVVLDYIIRNTGETVVFLFSTISVNEGVQDDKEIISCSIGLD